MADNSEVYVTSAVSSNAKQLQLARGLVCAFAGCVAGVLGFGWMEGFLLFGGVSLFIGFIMMISVSFIAKRETPSVTMNSYIPSLISYFPINLNTIK